MNTGILTAAWMCVVLSQSPGGVHYTNQRNHEIPVNAEASVRAGLREFILYMSRDEGRTWEQYSRIDPSKQGFAFYAQGDGTYWFQVAFVNRAGVQDPDDKTIQKGPAHLRMVIDTLKPIVRSFQAQRQGDEVLVTWDLQEEHPDLSKEGMRWSIRSRTRLIETWYPIADAAGLERADEHCPDGKTDTGRPLDGARSGEKPVVHHSGNSRHDRGGRIYGTGGPNLDAAWRAQASATDGIDDSARWWCRSRSRIR